LPDSAKPVPIARPRSRVEAILTGQTRGPNYYARPSFSGDERVFTDLAAYAPGMSSGTADVRAVLEAEAAPHFGNRRGSLDPAARKSIEAPRSPAGVRTEIKPADGQPLTVVHDGQGRFAYEHRLPLGLVERVVCDGTTLLHLYPELGIGARRTVTRFHRAEFAALCPDVLPPADDLAFGANVTRVDDHTVALVPLQMPEAEAGENVRWVEERLSFDAGGLTGRRWVLMKQGKELGREEYDPSGTVQRFDADRKVILTAKRDRQADLAHDVKPDLRG